jgi:hypothetical protein
MLRLIRLLFLTFMLMLIVQPALALDVSVCRDTSVDWLRYRFSGVDRNAENFSYFADGATFESATVLIADALTEDIDAVHVAGTAAVLWLDLNTMEAVEVIGNPNTAPCGGSEAWQPGAPSIIIPASGPGPYLIEIQDKYGNWHLVRDDANPDGIVVYNKGGSVELIGSVGQDTDPKHYRLVEPDPANYRGMVVNGDADPT